MQKIVHPYPGVAKGWDWADHKARGYIGGTDYKTYPGRNVTACATGTAYRISASEVSIRLVDGRRINYRELRSTWGTFPRQVRIGDRIGTTGLVRNGTSLWAHMDAQNVAGVRIDFERVFEKYLQQVARQERAAKLKAAQAERKRLVRLVAKYLNGRHLGARTGAVLTGIPGPVYWRMIQKWGRGNGFYKGSVNGAIDEATRATERELIKRISA